jgi:hypothetical protein
MGLSFGLLVGGIAAPNASMLQIVCCYAGTLGLFGGMFRCLVNIKAQERMANPQPHPLQEILSARNPMERLPEPAEPELPKWPDLWWEILDHDPLIQQIHRAAEQAGLCRDCGKSEYHDDPELECGCIGGNRAQMRYQRRLSRLYDSVRPKSAQEQSVFMTEWLVFSDEVRERLAPKPDACAIESSNLDSPGECDHDN